MKKIYYEITLIILVAFWGLSFSLTKSLLSHTGVFNFLAYRFVIGSVLLVVLALLLKRFKLNKALLKHGFITGTLLFLAFYCHIEGLKHTSIAKNAFIVGSSVIFIPIILKLLYKENSSKLVYLQTTLAIIGLGIITLINTDIGFSYGDSITLLGSVIYAMYTITVEKSVRKLDAMMFTTVQLATVGILSLTASFLLEDMTASYTVSEWASIAFMAIVLTGLSYYVLNMIQKSVSASTVTLIFTFEPFFATLFGWFFFNEVIGNNIIIGGALILLSVVLPYISFKRKRVEVGYE